MDVSPERAAQEAWESENAVETIPWCDEIFRCDEEEQRSIVSAQPWEGDPHFFKDIHISALAMLKMVMHARSGKNYEVMGSLFGKVFNNIMIVMDSFALPVEGTETRVNAHEQAYEYMTTYVEAAKQVGRKENLIGWYHSHPGYGCWLSGIDVSTQMLNQTYSEPFVALVIDPVRTVSSGKVCIGAFRTYRKGYVPPDEDLSEYQTIPLDKIEDFGVHCKQYYQLDITYFKSDLDSKLLSSLWNKYWVNTLGSSGLHSDPEYVTKHLYDLSQKLEKREENIMKHTSQTSYWTNNARGFFKRSDLDQETRDCCQTSIELCQGLMNQVVKNGLFNSVGLKNK